VKSLERKDKTKKMLRKTLYLWLVLGVCCFAFCGMKNRENIQMRVIKYWVFYAEMYVIEMINIYLLISYIIQASLLSHNFLRFA
jgi:hypothetical protein